VVVGSTEKRQCSVCGSKRQRHLIYIYKRLGKVFGSYTDHSFLKYSDVQCTRCVIYSYRYFWQQWVKKHFEEWNKSMSKPAGFQGKTDADYSDMYRLLPDQKTAVNDFRKENEDKQFFSLESYRL